MNQEIQQFITDEVKRQFILLNTNFNVPFHVHNGFDAPSIPVKNLLNANSGTATYNPASLNDGTGVTTTVTVVGAALGDFALASFSLDLQGILLTAYVSAADTVSVRFQNETTGTINLSDGTLTALSIRL